jgi:hypothetical protein
LLFSRLKRPVGAERRKPSQRENSEGRSANDDAFEAAEWKLTELAKEVDYAWSLAGSRRIRRVGGRTMEKVDVYVKPRLSAVFTIRLRRPRA